MQTNTQFLTPTEANIIIANVLPSGAAFAVRADSGDNCYVPAAVSNAVKAQIGSTFTAFLVPNRYPDKVERTPWLVTRINKAVQLGSTRPVQYAMPFSQFDQSQPAAPPQPTTADRVRATMQHGGVWTLSSLFEELFPGKTRGDSLTDYNAISAAIRGMYAKGECAKFQLWRSSDQSKPSREWFTCYPERADVDEWDEWDKWDEQ